jgi:hypothetical protein
MRAIAPLAVAAAVALTIAAGAAASPALKSIQAENALAGTPWTRAEADTPAVQGYSSSPSIEQGQTLELHISTEPAARYRIEIFRLGWYGGVGARRVACLPSCSTTKQGMPQPTPSPASDTGELRAGWPATDVVNVQRSWTSGYYLANAETASGRASIPFVVRAASDAPPTAILVDVPVNTWQAYNAWGGKSLYAFNSRARAAVKVSFDRPFERQTLWSLFAHELPLARFLEREGYDVSYTTDVDVAKQPNELLRHRLVVTAGHSEYWTRSIRDAFETARDAGTNLAFVGADTGSWQARYEDNYRTLVEYRDGAADPVVDPGERTDLFRTLGRAECSLRGNQYAGGKMLVGTPPSPNYIVAASTDPWFRGTGLSDGQFVAGLIGYEWDTAQPRCLDRPETVLLHYEGAPLPGDAVRYTASSGARVFSAGAMQFSWGLDASGSSSNFVSTGLQQFMRNVLSDLMQPAPPSAVTAQPAATGVAVQASLPTDPRVNRVLVMRHEGVDEFGVDDPTAVIACEGAGSSCVDSRLPGHRTYRFAAMASDAWGHSEPRLSSPVVVPNTPPSIALHVRRSRSGVATILATAEDRDGDRVAYAWRVDGAAGPTGNVLRLTSAGRHAVNVSVSDSFGGTTTANIVATVRISRR